MKKYILFIGVLVFVFIFLIYFSFSKNVKQVTPTPTPTTPLPTQPVPLPKGAMPNNYFSDKNASEAVHRDYVVGQLIDKLPHQETNLVLSYDIDKNIFTAVIDSSDKNKGLAQLDAVLKINSIASRSWIENLKILYK